MSYEQNNSLNFYRFSAIALGVGILAVTICGSLGLVWMRQQVSAMAGSAARLQAQIIEAERLGAGIEARLARELSPQHLAGRLPQGLRPSASNQFVWAPAPQMLNPVAGVEAGTMIASRGSARGAGQAVASNAAATAQQAAVSAEVAAANARSHLVSMPSGAAPVAQSQAQASVSVTFDLALSSNQASAGAAARQ